jgi:hypothetical protein
MVKTTTGWASGWWNKKPSNTATNVTLLIFLGAMVLFEACVPRPLLHVYDWRYVCAFIMFSACGVLLFGSGRILYLWARKSPNFISLDIFRVSNVLWMGLAMAWFKAFTDYKRISPSFDSYASYVFLGFLIGVINAAKLRNHPSED